MTSEELRALRGKVSMARHVARDNLQRAEAEAAAQLHCFITVCDREADVADRLHAAECVAEWVHRRRPAALPTAETQEDPFVAAIRTRVQHHVVLAASEVARVDRVLGVLDGTLTLPDDELAELVAWLESLRRRTSPG